VRRRFDEQLVDVAPRPILTRLEAANERVLRLIKVLGRVLPDRIVAAANVTAGQTESKVNPPRAGREAFLASLRRAGRDVVDLGEVGALIGHGVSKHVLA
jgi:hypothetical protein